MTSYFQDGCRDVCPPLAAVDQPRLPASPPISCDVIRSLYALQFLIYPS